MDFRIFFTLTSIAFSSIISLGYADSSNDVSQMVQQNNFRVQGQSQGAGTPNAVGVGGFFPFHTTTNSTMYLDLLINVNLSDFDGTGREKSSIINTDVSGPSLSISSRLGYRWLSDGGSWMYGVNAGYDTRRLNSGGTDTAVAASNKNNVTFQQVAFGFEAISESWGFNAYSLLHVGEYEKQLNSAYQGGVLNTYGLDLSRNLTSKIKASAGIYHQENNLEHIDGTGYRASLNYDVGNGYEVNWTLSDDKGYDTRGVLSLRYLFGSKPKTSSIAKAFNAAPENRDVRVHDGVR